MKVIVAMLVIIIIAKIVMLVVATIVTIIIHNKPWHERDRFLFWVAVTILG